MENRGGKESTLVEGLHSLGEKENWKGEKATIKTPIQK